MCRLVAFAAPTPRSVADAVGERALADLHALACLHGDGWGMASVTEPGRLPEVEVSPQSAATDPAFPDAVHRPGARASLLHLRWATLGLAVRPENSHPFLADGVAFGHNGSLQPLGELDALLTPAERATLRGSTDSERYFAVVRRHLATSPDLAAAVAGAVAELRPRFPTASLNAVALDAHQLVAVHASARSSLPPEDAAELAGLPLPSEHVDDYFGLRMRRGDDGTVVFSSTGLASQGWQALPPESVTAVDLDDCTLRTVQLVPS